MPDKYTPTNGFHQPYGHLESYYEFARNEFVPSDVIGDPNNYRQEIEPLLEDLPLSDAVVNRVLESLNHWEVSYGLHLVKSFDPATHKHMIRVAAIAAMLGEDAELCEQEHQALTMAAIVHDLGKLSIDRHIVNPAADPGGRIDRTKSGRDYRYEQIKTHPERGYRSLHNLFRGFESLEQAQLISELCLCHHCFNHSPIRPRYPTVDDMSRLIAQGMLSADPATDPQKSRLGRLLALADVEEAITANRKYQDGWFDSERRRLEALIDAHPDMPREIGLLMVFDAKREEMQLASYKGE